MIEDGNRVSIEYTLELEDGSVADSNVGGDPLHYEHGQGQILRALETSLVGLEVDERKKVTLSPAQGYGDVDPDAFQTVPLAHIPENAREVGAQLISESPSGQRQLIRVSEVLETEAVLDLNHPLAGQTLVFDIKVLSIE